MEGDVGANPKYGATVQYSGKVSYTYAFSKKVSCINRTPQYGLACTFDIGSLTMTADMVKLKVSKQTLDLSILGNFVDPRYTIQSRQIAYMFCFYVYMKMKLPNSRHFVSSRHRLSSF